VEPTPWYFEAQDAGDARRQRRDFVDYLRTYGECNDDYEAAEVIYGEMVSNVVRHSPGPIQVSVDWPHGSAQLHVKDTGPPLATGALTVPLDPYAESGRGLFIVDQLASDVTIIAHPGDGKTISAELPVHFRSG
jgi:anti-sigma regulatory factor (Ser/Thr protein kinase)